MSESKPRVFISFVTEDKGVAAAVQSLIEKRLGLKVRSFCRRILPGHDWLGEIRAVLESAELLVADAQRTIAEAALD